jgi:proteasome accessory factor C
MRMDRFDRIFALHKIFCSRRTPISRRELEYKLECSAATTKRGIADMRDFLGAPIKFNRQQNGYYYDANETPLYELPGLWFSAEEIFALLTTQQLLSRLQPGILEPHLAPLRKRLDELLKNQRIAITEIDKNIRILQMAPRLIDVEIFRKIADALFRKKRIKMLYSGRERGAITERWVSPQRLVYYRSNWYLDGWCHLRNNLRSFSLDRIEIIYTGEQAKVISEKKLNEHYGSAYGIFAGKPKHKAVIHFSSSAARWVADEHWHSQQESRSIPGGWEITIPYNDPRELIMDILKYGADAEVIKPKRLRVTIKQKLENAVALYRSGS